MNDSASVSTPRDRRAARRRAAVATSAERQLRDHRFDVIRTPGRRRALAAALLLAIGTTSTLFWFGRSLLAVAALIIGIALWLLLRIAVRTIADLPAEYLDERQEQVRDQAYVESYRWIAAVAVLSIGAALLLVIVTGADPDAITVTVTMDQIQAVFWAINGLALSLPSLFIALREPAI